MDTEILMMLGVVMLTQQSVPLHLMKLQIQRNLYFQAGTLCVNKTMDNSKHKFKSCLHCKCTTI